MKNTSYKPAVMAEISWTLDDMGVLTISGAGKMPDYACGKKPEAPWEERKDAIESLVVEDGITEIGINAFRDCRNLKSVKLPHTVRRIHGYAFHDCIGLEIIESERSEWRYIYDKRPTAEADTVIFGVESFLNCPWATTKWNNYYLQDGVLYVCFTGNGRMEIPEGTHTLYQFSMADIAVDEIICPSTLERAEAFAFSDTIVRKGIRLPEQMEYIDRYALADSNFGSIRLPKGYAPAGMKNKKTYLYGDEKMLDLKRAPEFVGKYYLGTEKIKGSDGFRRLKIMERKPVFHKNGQVTSVWDNDYLDVGKSVLSKIQRGSALVCIEHEDGKVVCVKVIAMRRIETCAGADVHENIPCVYLMYPEQNGSSILPWRDSYTFFQSSEVRDGFLDGNGKALAESGKLRFRHQDTHEEWFWCTPDENEWWGLAFGALRLWLAEHPEIRVDTKEENMEEDAYRWFVSV